MSILTYKNILAVSRECKNQPIVQLLRDNYRFWFPEQRPLFSYASTNDKIVIFYPQSSMLSNTITQLKDDETFSRNELPIGALKFLADGGSMIKIVECKFHTSESFKECLVLFREYLLETIRKLNLSDYSSLNFIIYWDEKLLNPIVSDAIKQTGLLTDDKDLSHSFTISEIQGGPPKIIQEFKFGSSQQPYKLENPFEHILYSTNNSQQSPQQPFSFNPQQPSQQSFGFNQQQPFGFNQQQPSQQPFSFNQQQPSQQSFGFNQQPTINKQQSMNSFGLNQYNDTISRQSLPFVSNQSMNIKPSSFNQTKSGIIWNK